MTESESMNHISAPPDLGQEKADRLAQRDKIAALFRLSPLQDIEPEALRLITPHYQQRISEMRRPVAKGGLGMAIENVRRTRQDASGAVHRSDGAYLYRPTGKSLGRAAGAFTQASWPTEHGRPFEPEFRLTAPESR